MLKYCCYDTLLMVAIFQRLKEFIAQYNYDFELLISEINFATKNI
jgi:hypothetical protein